MISKKASSSHLPPVESIEAMSINSLILSIMITKRMYDFNDTNFTTYSVVRKSVSLIPYRNF